MRRILFISRDYASDFGNKVSGMFQRMHLLLDAATKVADALDILFFVDQRMIETVGPEPARQSLRQHWGIDANVLLAPRAGMRHSPLIQTLVSLRDHRAQEDYFRLQGGEQRAAVGAAVRFDTDLIVAHQLPIGSMVVAASPKEVPIVMDLNDIEHRKRARQLALSSSHGLSRFAKLELPALKRGELATLKAFSTSFVCSDADHDYLTNEGVPNTTVIPNAMRFDDEVDESNASDPATLFFIGTYNYRPNLDAAEFLINEVFPLVRERRPEARLVIAGESSEKLPSFNGRPKGVEFAGFVSDLAEVYRRATVVCCPILAGGGTRIKIIEAAAARKAIVSTTVGAEGLALDDGSEILLRDTAASFAAACLELFDDRSRATALGNAAYVMARSQYERGAIVERIARAFENHARKA